MADQQDKGKAEDAIFLADMLLAQEEVSIFISVAPSEEYEEVPTVSQDNSSQHLFDTEMQMLKDIVTSSEQPSEQPSTSSLWSLRQTAVQDEWRKARAHHIDCLLFCNEVPDKKCSHCTSPAIIRCRDCMPDEWLCMECGIQIHTKLTLHNRDSCIGGIYKPIKPTVCCAKKDGMYSLVSQERLLPTVRPSQICKCDPVDITESAGRAVILVCINGRYDLHMPNLLCRFCLAQWTPDGGDFIKRGYWAATVHADTLFSIDVFSTFKEMKTVAPSLSRQAFLQMLESRTVHCGRTFQKAQAESQTLEDLISEVGCPKNMVQQWILLVPDVMTFSNQSNKCFLVYIKRKPVLLSYTQTGSSSEEGHRGLLCLLQKRLADVEEKFQVVCSSYSQALGPNAGSLLEDGPEEILEDHKEFDYESSDDSDFEAV
ncbi:hypothetical protein ABVT39_023702 [Epinephelus coioides]